MMRARGSWLVLLMVALATSGCGFFGKRSSYERARETRPLEVPPDLESPSTASALEIPQPGAGSDAVSSTLPGSSAEPPGTVSPPSTIVAGEDTSLSLTDSPAGAFRRVSLALERSQVAEIVSRDEGAGTISVRGTSTVRTEEGGRLKRMFTRDKVETRTVERVVRVQASGSGSEVRVEDAEGNAVDDELARRIIAALKQRLG